MQAHNLTSSGSTPDSATITVIWDYCQHTQERPRRHGDARHNAPVLGLCPDCREVYLHKA